MNVSIYSRKTIEQLIANGFPDNVAVISFYDLKTGNRIYNQNPVDYKNKCSQIFYVYMILILKYLKIMG